MKFAPLAVALTVLALTACGKPTAPESPDVSTYGTVIKQDHHIPEKDREGTQEFPVKQLPDEKKP